MSGSLRQFRGGRYQRFLMLMLGVCLTACAAVDAQTTRQIPAGLYDNQPIRRTNSDSPATTRSAAHVDPARPGDVMQRMVLALGIVLAIIFTLRWIGRRYFPAVVGAGANAPVRVLSRSAVTPKQQVLLLRVGRRVLVVADNGTQMSPLSEITDPDEVAQLIGHATSGHGGGVFESAFGKARQGFEQVQPPDGTEPVDSPEAEQTPEVAEGDSIATAQGEIKGLMEKVQGLVKQLGRP